MKKIQNYINGAFIEPNSGNYFDNYDFWIARQNGINNYPDNNQPKKEPFLFDQKCPLIWQYSGTGSINGVKGKVDLNITNQIFWEQ